MKIVDITKQKISRRSFLKGASFGVGIPVLGGVLAACGGAPTQAATQNMDEMTPAAIKSLGYLVSTISVLLLGVASWPGAARAGLTVVLVLGMTASILGMACRWYSYRLEKRQRDR